MYTAASVVHHYPRRGGMIVVEFGDRAQRKGAEYFGYKLYSARSDGISANIL